MEKWIIPSIVVLLILIIVWPWFLVILGAFGVFYGSLLLYYNNVLPPPYLSLNGKSEIVISWFSKRSEATAVILSAPMSCVQIPESQIVNEFTGKFQINTCTIHNLCKDQKVRYEIVQIPQTLQKKPKTLQHLLMAPRLFSGKRLWIQTPKNIFNAPDSVLSVAVLGDLQPKPSIPPLFQLYMLKQIKRQAPDLLLFLGDHTMEGTDVRGWIQFYHVLGVIACHTPVLGIPGNHDLKLRRKGGIRRVNDVYNTFTNYPEPKLRYFLDLPSVQIIAFDFTSGFELNSANYQLLQDSLPIMKKEKWIISMWHSSPYNSLKTDPTTEAVRKNVVPILDQKGCRLWLGGHEHSYQRYRTNETYFITSAATSSFHKHWDNRDSAEKLLLQFHFLRIDIARQSLQMQAISWRNTIIDKIQMEKEI